ncbi:hypothetical protein RJ55_04921 [Drechmeria coniospora]|nr:hypothetical protein RJ55_04921 [Drechmeria coniospora]
MLRFHSLMGNYLIPVPTKPVICQFLDKDPTRLNIKYSDQPSLRTEHKLAGLAHAMLLRGFVIQELKAMSNDVRYKSLRQGPGVSWWRKSQSTTDLLKRDILDLEDEYRAQWRTLDDTECWDRWRNGLITAWEVYAAFKCETETVLSKNPLPGHGEGEEGGQVQEPSFGSSPDCEKHIPFLTTEKPTATVSRSQLRAERRGGSGGPASDVQQAERIDRGQRQRTVDARLGDGQQPGEQGGAGGIGSRNRQESRCNPDPDAARIQANGNESPMCQSEHHATREHAARPDSIWRRYFVCSRKRSVWRGGEISFGVRFYKDSV